MTRNSIVICLGSSCYARGNSEHLQIIEDFLDTHHLKDKVELSGSCCEGRCTEGPQLVVNGNICTRIDRVAVREILRQHLLPIAQTLLIEPRT